MSPLRALCNTTIGSFRPGAMPLMSRRNYSWELLSAAFFPLALACVEGATLGVIAKKAFDAPDWAIATLTAAPVLANLTSLTWTRVLRGRDRVRVVNILQVLAILCVLAIAATPVSDTGLFVVMIAAFLGRCLMTGIITGRSDLWRSNYSRRVRARITGKLTMVAAVTVALSALAIGQAMDMFAGAPVAPYRALYLCAGLAALVGVWAFSHIRWRRGASTVLAERRADDAEAPGLTRSARQMLGVLRRDRDYRRFMAAQFVLGVPNVAAMPVFIIALEERVAPSYLLSVLLAEAIPLLTPMLAIPLWSRLLDRVHVVRFRVFHGWTFVIANLLMAVGLYTQSLPILFLSRVALGFGFGGGMIAWNIGHHDFAKRDLATIYMGIHVTLTGVRGAFAPFLGAILWGGASLGAITFIPALREATFLVLAAVGVVAVSMFVRLDRDMAKAGASALRDND